MKVMANSIPKGGTHLLLRLLTLLGFTENRFWVGADLVHGQSELLRGGTPTDRIWIGSEVPVQIGRDRLYSHIASIPDGAVFGAHCLYSIELADLLSTLDARTVCILRDPRAIAASHLDYIRRSPHHFFHHAYMALPDDDARLMMSIRGGKLAQYELQPLAERYRTFVDWGRAGGAVVVRFEDLVGEHGGGSRAAQAGAVRAVVEFLGLDVDSARLEYVESQLFGSTSTFRKGRVDSWRSELPEVHKHILEEELSDLLKELGYTTERGVSGASGGAG